MKINKEILKKNNHLGVKKLIKEIKDEIYNFQSESESEDNLIILGLLNLIKKIKINNLNSK